MHAELRSSLCKPQSHCEGPAPSLPTIPGQSPPLATRLQAGNHDPFTNVFTGSMATAAITGNSATSPNASGGRSSSSSCSITFPSVSASHFATSHRPAPLILPVFTPSPSPTPRGLPSRSPVFCLPKIADLASPSRAKPSPNAVSPGREADVTCHVRRANTQNATLDKVGIRLRARHPDMPLCAFPPPPCTCCFMLVPRSSLQRTCFGTRARVECKSRLSSQLRSGSLCPPVQSASSVLRDGLSPK